MRLKNFKVQNYKVFEDEFSVELIKQTRKEGNFTILTGKNNMGKSTFLEAINEFFKPNTKPLCIPSDCFNNKSNSIVNCSPSSRQGK
ncbi:AAA family ATPase [Enterococcus casseliflavus]|uniref:AAA family ATPase n=1 Tax=Enterococcus casseliflavus TaxID=37734 RepID=UPI0035CC8AFC